MHRKFLNRKGIDNIFQIFKISRSIVHIQLPTPLHCVRSHALKHEKGILAPGFFEINGA